MRFFLSECCVVFKLDTMGQCLVHWTPLSDLSKPLSLCFVEVTFDMDVTCNFLDKALVQNIAVLAIIRVNARKIISRTYRLQWQILELAVPRDRHTVRRQHLWDRFSSGLRECFCSS